MGGRDIRVRGRQPADGVSAREARAVFSPVATLG